MRGYNFYHEGKPIYDFNRDTIIRKINTFSCKSLYKIFSGCPQKTTSYNDYMQTFILRSSLYALLFFVICMEKLIELVIFYRLVKIFRIISDERRNFGNSDTLPGCSYIVPRTPPVCEKNPGESDDDVGQF